jgi:hypothetical protein
VYRKDNVVKVNWSVENETNMEDYVIERSDDGIVFTDVNHQVPDISGQTKIYEGEDLTAGTDAYFYRIRGVSIGGKIQYSEIKL